MIVRSCALFAIADLHLAHAVNRAAFSALEPHPQDWLIIAGDIAERLDRITEGFAMAREKFARVIWAPGNHDLWTAPAPDARDGTQPVSPAPARRSQVQGDRRLRARASAWTRPRTPNPVWDGPGGPCLIAPLFLLYDYSFRPPDIARDDVVAWAREGRGGLRRRDPPRPEPSIRAARPGVRRVSP